MAACGWLKADIRTGNSPTTNMADDISTASLQADTSRLHVASPIISMPFHCRRADTRSAPTICTVLVCLSLPSFRLS